MCASAFEPLRAKCVSHIVLSDNSGARLRAGGVCFAGMRVGRWAERRPWGWTMDRRWLPLNALRAFEAAGQHLSFTAAANSLTVAQSAVSRHVIVLENFLGVTLFERRPQQLVLTEAGRHILPVVSKSFDRIDQAIGEVIKEKGRPKRVLRVALPTSFAHRLAIPILRDFRDENPGITLEIVSKPTTAADTDAGSHADAGWCTKRHRRPRLRDRGRSRRVQSDQRLVGV